MSSLYFFYTIHCLIKYIKIMSENLPQPITLQDNSIPLNTLADGSNTNDVLTWNGTAWISAAASGGTIQGTTNQINANTVGSTTTLTLSSTLVIPGTLTVTNNTTLNGSAVNKEVISTSTALSTTLDSLINTVNGSLSCTLATGLPYQTKTISLNTLRSNTATISCSTGGSFDLTPIDPVRNLYYDANSGSWQIEGGVSQTTPVPLSFYVSRQQGAKLIGTGGSSVATQGSACALSADGNTLAVGGFADNSGKGAVWVYTRSGTTWTQQGSKLVGTGGSAFARQGYAVAISSDGNTIASGALRDNNDEGATYIFTRTSGLWTQQGPKIIGTGGSAFANQGFSVALSADGNTLAIGGLYDNADVGAVWIFTRTATTWTQQGTKLIGTGATGAANQGAAVSLSADGNILAVGGSSDNSAVGATWIFTRTGTVWTQQGTKIIGTGQVGASQQGTTLSLNAFGNLLAIGGPTDNANQGATWIFARSGSTWTQQGTKLVGTGNTGAAKQSIICALSADGNTLVATGNDDNSSVGATWIFTRSANVWSQKGPKIVGSGATGASAQGGGASISANGNTVAVGGSGDNTNVGAVWIYI